MSGTFTPRVDRAFAYRAHLLALAGGSAAFGPAYARNDRRLRPPERGRPKREAGEAPTGGEEDISALLQARAGSQPSTDAAWFARRWSAGDEASCEREAARVAAAADTQPDGGLLDGWRVEVLVAIPLLPSAWPGAKDDAARRISIGVGPGVPGVVALLAAIATRMPPAPSLEGLSPGDVHAVRLHMAGTALVRRLDSPALLDALVDEAAPALLPPQHQGHRLTELVARLSSRGLLDQPPGEIERLSRGLARRRPDRLHRAWQRAFFVPRGYPLDEWLARA